MAMNRVNHLYSRAFIAASFNIRAGGIFLNLQRKEPGWSKAGVVSNRRLK